MGTPMTASTICLITFGAKSPASDQSKMLFHVHVKLPEAMSDHQSLIMATLCASAHTMVVLAATLQFSLPLLFYKR